MPFNSTRELLEALLTWITRSFGVINYLMGLVLLLSPPERYTSASYEPLLRLSDDRPGYYGAILIISGTLILCQKREGILIGYALGLVVYNLLAALFIVAAFINPEAATTPTIAYGGYALLQGIGLGFTYIAWRQSRITDGG